MSEWDPHNDCWICGMYFWCGDRDCPMCSLEIPCEVCERCETCCKCLIDDLVAFWHDGYEGLESLREFLGMTESEYKLFVEKPSEYFKENS